MSNRIDGAFKRLRAKGSSALVVYVTAGYPSLGATPAIIAALERSGADIVELGIPFSDPLADGPTIQAASQRALAGGVSVRKIFGMTARLRAKTDIPIVYMTYLNPVLRFGLGRFFNACRRTGVDGVIIPDLPVEESREVIASARGRGVKVILLAAPTSPEKRIRTIAQRTSGFLYYVSTTGVTGGRRSLPKDLVARLKTVRSLSSAPVCVGFGVSSPAQAGVLASHADGVIVGSSVIDVISAHASSPGAAARAVSTFVAKLANAVHAAKRPKEKP